MRGCAQNTQSKQLLLAASLTIALLLRPAIAISAEEPSYTDYVDFPEAEWTLIPDEDAELVEGYCTACHSLAPVLQHVGFTSKAWAAEVKNMVDRFGAPLDEETSSKIIAYLAKHYRLEAVERTKGLQAPDSN